MIIHFIGNSSSNYGRNKGDKDLKQRVRRNSMIAAGVGTVAGLGIGGYLVLKHKKPFTPIKAQTVDVPNNPLSHLKPAETFKNSVEKLYAKDNQVADNLENLINKRAKESFQNTGGWLLRKPRANMKIKSQKRLIDTEKANVRSKLKTEEEMLNLEKKYGNRTPTIKTVKGKKKFKFKSQ